MFKINKNNNFLFSSEKKVTVFLVFLLVPYFKLDIFTINGTFIDVAFNILRVITALFIYIKYCYCTVKDHYYSIPFICYFILKTYILFNTIFRYGFNRDNVMSYLIPITLLMIIDIYSKYKPRELIHSLLLIFEVLIVSNFIFMVIFPKGIIIESINYKSHLIGTKNVLDTFFIIGLTFSLLYKEVGGSKNHFVILMTISILSELICHSIGGLFCLFFYFLLYFTKFYLSKYFSLRNIIIVYILFFIFVVILRFQNLLTPLLNFFNRDATFTLRTSIWDGYLKNLPNYFITGMGEMPYMTRYYFFGRNVVHNHAHNFILEIIFEAGIIGLLFIIIFFLSILKIISKNNGSLIIKYIILGCAPLIIHALVEASFGNLDFILYILLYHFNYIKKNI